MLRVYRAILAAALAMVWMASGPAGQASDKTAGGSVLPSAPAPTSTAGTTAAGSTASSTSQAQHEAEIRKRVEGIRRQVQDLQARASRIERQLRELPPRHYETGRALRAELRQVVGQFVTLTQQLPDPANREKLIHRLTELRDDIRKLRESGRDREADQLQRDAIEIMEALVGLHDRGPTAAKNGDGPDQRLSHLRNAIAELDAAGLYEQSQRLREELRRLQRETRAAEAGSRNPEKQPRTPSRADTDK
jgi:hypothetical protein